MNKISSQQVRSILKTASTTIRSLESENTQLREKLASKEKRERIEKIAQIMESKGLQPDLDFNQKVAHLLQVPNLDVTEEAVKLASPQMCGLGDVGHLSAQSARSAFEAYLATGEDVE